MKFSGIDALELVAGLTAVVGGCAIDWRWTCVVAGASTLALCLLARRKSG